MRKIFKEWKSFLNEQQKHFEVHVELRYQKDFNLYGNVFNQIRAIDGVTVSKTADPGVITLSADKRKAILKVKFMPTKPLLQYLEYLRTKLMHVKDSEGDQVLFVKIVQFPKDLEKK